MPLLYLGSYTVTGSVIADTRFRISLHKLLLNHVVSSHVPGFKEITKGRLAT